MATLAALMMVPLVLCVGAAVDFSRLAQAQAGLQDAVDNAALSGAAAYIDSTQSANAAAVATRYFSGYILPSGLTLVSGSPAVSAASGTTPTGNGYNVTVSASGILSVTIMGLAKFSTFTLSATATASNPIVLPRFSVGGFGASAADWNSIYLYPVSLDSKGNPQYTAVPSSSSSYYELGSNCNSSSQNYSSQSRCVGQSGATVPTNQTFPTITATQPLAFALKNVTDGLYASSSNGYGDNGYNAPPGGTNLFSAAFEAAGYPPSLDANYSYTQQVTSNGKTSTETLSTEYPTSGGTAASNCALIIEQVNPSSLPTSPPSSGKCFTDTNTASGYQYAALSCAKMAGRTFMYWWNDMGGPSDDGDYNDAYYTVSCSLGNGATVTNTTNASTATSGLSVVLIQ